MSVTARTICTDALMDLGIVGAEETPEAADIQFAFRALNRFVASLPIQSLTVPAVQRVVLQLVANQGTYTIGPGGDFDLPRPVTISGAGLLLAGFSGPRTATGITASGFVATVTLTAHGFSIGDEIVISGASQTGYNGPQVVETVPTSGTFTYALDDTVTSPAVGTILVYTVTDTGVEMPRAVITDDAYEAIQIKRLTNTLFTTVYYNATASPFGVISLWPIPTTASNQLVLYLPQVFAAFADLSTAYTWPTTPGYQEMLQYNLEKRLIGPFAVKDPIVVQTALDFARTTLALVKRANYKLTDLPMDPAFARSFGGGYNINTGTGGGATS